MMDMVIDMLDTIAVIAAASRTEAELQVGEIHIRPAADLTLAVVGPVLHFPFDTAGFCPEIADVLLPLDSASAEQLSDPRPAEYEVVQQRHDGKQVHREGVEEHTKNKWHSGDDCQPFHLYRDEPKNQKLCIRIQGSKGKVHCQVDIMNRQLEADVGNEPHHSAVHNGQYDAAEIINSELPGPPGIFQGIADEIIQIQPEHQPNTGAFRDKNKGDEPPDLTMLKHPLRGEGQHIDEGTGGVHGIEQPHGQSADDDEHHEPGDAEPGMGQAKTVDLIHEFSQSKNPPQESFPPVAAERYVQSFP